MNIFVNSLGIFTALFIGIYIGGKTNAQTALTETARNMADKIKKLAENKKAIIISPTAQYKKNLLNKELKEKEI